MRICLVGGATRDKLTGVPCKDFDFSVEIPELVGKPIDEGFAEMVTHLESEAFRIFLSTPEFVTVRAMFPVGHVNEGMVADFVLCRKDGPSSDGRRPDFVECGTLRDDLDRRDLRMNAIAEDILTGEIIDPHNGRLDIERREINFVGIPEDRIREDGLRVMRAFRFVICKGFTLGKPTEIALNHPESAEMLASVSTERKREELEKMFRADTLGSLNLISSLPAHTQEAMFPEGLRLSATMKKN